jgi:hypothetical protein
VPFLFFLAIKITFSKKKCVLTVDKKGVWDNTTVTNIPFVSWDEIKGFRIIDYSNQKYISIDLHNSTETLKRAPIYKRLLLRLNALTAKAFLLIPLTMIPVDGDEFLSWLHKTHSKIKRKSQK